MFKQLMEFLVTLLLGLVLSKLWDLIYNVFPRRRAWQISIPTQTYFTVATPINRTGKPQRPNVDAALVDPDSRRPTAAPFGTYLGEVRALGILLPDFSRAHKTFDSGKVIFSDQLPLTFYDCDIVCVGGPVWNTTTRFFLEQLKDRLPFAVVDHEIILKVPNPEGRTRFTPEYDANGNVKRDIGVIVKCNNPKDRQRGCLMFFGLRTYGVEAAARAFVDNLVKYRHVWPSHYFSMVEAEVHDHSIGPPRVLIYKTF